MLLGVFNIEPHDVHRDVGLVELGLHVLHISLVEVVPTALVVSGGEELRKRSATREGGVLLEDIGAAGTEEDEEVEDARLGHPVRRGGGGGRTSVGSLGGTLLRLLEGRGDFLGRWLLGDVDPSFGATDEEDTDRRAGAVSLHEGNGAVL